MSSEDEELCCVASECGGDRGDLLSIMSIKQLLFVQMFVIPSSRHRFCRSGFLKFLSRNSLVGNSREGSGGSCDTCVAAAGELPSTLSAAILDNGG